MVPTATTFGFVIVCIEAGVEAGVEAGDEAGVAAGDEAGLETELVMRMIIPEIQAFDLFISPYLTFIWPSVR